MKSLLVWFDNLPYGWLGCCGNTTAVTPGFDGLAARCVTFDNCFATDVDQHSAREALVKTIQAAAAQGAFVEVLTDRNSSLGSRLTSLPGVKTVTLPEVSSSDQHASTYPLGAALDALSVFSDSAEETLGVIALAGPTTPAELGDADLAVHAVLTRWMECSAEEARLLFVMAEGTALRPANDENTGTSLLCEARLHVAAFGLAGRPLEYGIRCHALVCPDDVVATLADRFGLHSAVETSGASLMGLLTDEPQVSRSHLILRGSPSDYGLRTRDWLLVTSVPKTGSAADRAALAAESAALFVKPDDACEQLNVASQSPEVVTELVQELLACLVDRPSDE